MSELVDKIINRSFTEEQKNMLDEIDAKAIINLCMDAAVQEINKVRNKKGLHGSDLSSFRHGCTESAKAIESLKEDTNGETEHS